MIQNVRKETVVEEEEEDETKQSWFTLIQKVESVFRNIIHITKVFKT